MALVKCTRDMRTYVLEKIDELFKERVIKSYELKGKTAEEIAEEVYSKIFTPDRIKVIKAMENEISGNCRILYDHKEFNFTAKTLAGAERKIAIKWSSPRLCFSQFTSGYNAPEISELTAEAKQAIIEAAQRRKAVIGEREAFKTGFNEAADKVKSINELIKLWPAVTELLPAGTMDRVNRKTGPRAKSEGLFDAATLNVQLLKAKVAK